MEIEKVRNHKNENEQEVLSDPPPSENLLWTQKYFPKRFTELISDEVIYLNFAQYFKYILIKQTNRNILQWFKSWDSIVFQTSKSKLVNF